MKPIQCECPATGIATKFRWWAGYSTFAPVAPACPPDVEEQYRQLWFSKPPGPRSDPPPMPPAKVVFDVHFGTRDSIVAVP
jgi:hypothetical protein